MLITGVLRKNNEEGEKEQRNSQLHRLGRCANAAVPGT
jgi:hypothetical protein